MNCTPECSLVAHVVHEEPCLNVEVCPRPLVESPLVHLDTLGWGATGGSSWVLAAEVKFYMILPYTFITRKCCFLHNNILMLRWLAMKLLLELSDEIMNSRGNAIELEIYFDCLHFNFY